MATAIQPTRPTAVESLRGAALFYDGATAAFAEGFPPAPRLTLSEWADEHRMLSPESSAEPGRWRTSRAPWLREIMDACSAPSVERVVYKKPAQSGGTEVANNFAGYFMDQDPCPVLVLQPTKELAHMWSKERLDPMMRDTPRLHGKVREGRRREKDQSILRKVFRGGYLAIIGANSAAGLRARPARALLADEVDAYPQSAKGSAKKEAKLGATGEGDPLSLARKRLTTFWNRKEFDCSTPTVEGYSRIDAEYQASSQGEWHVPCPHCGHEQTFKWRNIQWDPGEPESVRYLCGTISDDGELTAGCGEPIYEHHKARMNQRGRWIHRYPERKRVRGFWHNALCSHFISWAELVREWQDAQGKPEELKVFVNTRLAELWRDDGDEVSETALEARREPYPEGCEVPMGGAVLVWSCDVQGDRLEYKVKAFGPGERSYLVKYEKLWGDPGQPEVWRQLALAVLREFKHESGAPLKPRCGVIDSGGHHTEQVYRVARAWRKHNVWAAKGVGEAGRAAVKPPAKKSKHRLWTLGTIALKDIVFARLQTVADVDGHMSFPKWATSEYLAGLTSEKRITAYVRGRPSHTYVLKPGKRNEPLDLECMCLAALYILGPVRDRLDLEAKKLQPKPSESESPVSAPEPPANLAQLRRQPLRPRGGFVNRW